MKRQVSKPHSIIMVLCLMLTTSIFGSCTRSATDPTDSKTDLSYQADEFISAAEAEKIASLFVSTHEAFGAEVRSMDDPLKHLYTYNDSTILVDEHGLRSESGQSYAPYYHIYEVATGDGFVIVSGDGGTMPILAYSADSPFGLDDMPSSIQALLADYREEISYRRQHHLQPTQQMRELRADIRGMELRADNTVRPLLGTIKWNQSPYYNAYCPDGTPVGCVATATCMIMRYWEYPDRGVGTYRYWSNFARKYLSFDYNYDLNWDNMPRERLAYPNDDVASLSYGVAVGLEMNFGYNGSYSYQTDVPRVLTQHYQYPNTVRNVMRNDYTADQWADIILGELYEGRPVQYAGSGNGGGHSFVCDGYGGNGFYHINWGWGGMSDGYFRLNALDPNALGTGGGDGGFNYYQTAVIGIQPPARRPDPVVPDDNSGKIRYCDAHARMSTSLYIRKVSMAAMSNTSYGAQGGYAYFSGKEILLEPGQQVTLAVTPGFAGNAYQMYWTAWLDYNTDGTFSDSELIFKGYTTGFSEFRRTFRLPSRIPSGASRLRVIAKWGSYATACETFDYGEVEDYPVIFGSGSAPVPVEPTPTPVEPTPVDPTPVQPAPIVPEPTLTYCHSRGLDSDGFYIQRITFAGKLHSSGDNKGYADFTQSVPMQSSSIGYTSYSLTPGFRSFNKPAYWCIWVDSNMNGDFEESEKVASGKGINPVNGRFRNPSSWAKGGKYRVRISMSSDGYPTPCETIAHGEVEDYLLEINR